MIRRLVDRCLRRQDDVWARWCREAEQMRTLKRQVR